jgi:hypothetical protein
MPKQQMDRYKIITILAIGMSILLGSVNPVESVSSVSQTGRFAILSNFQEEAVLDRTTQLIWERSPSASEVTWSTAQTRCGLKRTGGQTDWRLPSFIELMTLIEPIRHQNSSLPALPAGHPFQRIKAGPYWTSDMSPLKPAEAYAVDFLRADVAPRQKDQPHPFWCVKGGIPEQPEPAPAAAQSGVI